MKNLELLERASEEIRQLRHQNQLQSARLEMFDDLLLLFKTPPNQRPYGMIHPDIVNELHKTIEAEKHKEADGKVMQGQASKNLND